MRALGFCQGEASRCVCINVEKELAVSVHGDDFTSTGLKCNFGWSKAKLEATYELKKGGRLGPGLTTQRKLSF